MVTLLPLIRIFHPAPRARICGLATSLSWGLNNSCAAFCKKIDAPMALIRGTRRGAFRSGRYAIFSSRYPVSADTDIPSTKAIMMEMTGRHSRR